MEHSTKYTFAMITFLVNVTRTISVCNRDRTSHVAFQVRLFLGRCKCCCSLCRLHWQYHVGVSMKNYSIFHRLALHIFKAHHESDMNVKLRLTKVDCIKRTPHSIYLVYCVTSHFNSLNSVKH